MNLELDKNQKLIMKLTTLPDFILIPLRKYCNLINYLNSTFHQSRYFMEQIEDGFLVFFKDLQTFNQTWDLFPPELLDRAYQMTDPNFIISSLSSKYEFPQKGIHFYLEPINIPLNLMFNPIKNFFLNLHPEICVTLLDFKLISIHFPTMNSVILYTNILEILSQHPELRRFS